MAALFSGDWMKAFGEAWNAEPELGDALAKIGFNSVIGYGFQGEDTPKGYIDVQNGHVVASGAYDGRSTGICAPPRATGRSGATRASA